VTPLLPRTIDNTYRGRRLALWLLGFVTIVKLLQIGSVLVDPVGIVAMRNHHECM
jgi:hypothetical protein